MLDATAGLTAADADASAAGWLRNPWRKPDFLQAHHVGATCSGRSCP